MPFSRLNQAIEGAPSYVDLRRRVLAFASLFSIFVIVVSVLGFIHLRQVAMEDAEHRAQSYRAILSGHLDRTMGAIDSYLSQIVVQSERLGGPSGANRQWQSVLETTLAGDDSIESLYVIDRHGVVRHSTLPQIVGESRRDGGIFLSLTDNDAPEIVSDSPFVSRFSGELLVPFGRRLMDARGRVTGAVVATFNPEALRDFYHRIDSEDGSVRILHRTGVTLLEEPQTPRPATAQPNVEGIVVGPIVEGGPTMVSSYGAVEDSGLIVAVSLGEAHALAAWRQEAIVGSLIIAGMLMALGAAVTLILRQLEARAAAEATLIQQQQRFAEAQRLESLGQLTGGVAHDFNNLLTVILNAADSLLARVSEDLRPRVDSILHAADNASDLIRQLLAFSRRQALQLSAVDVNATIVAMEDLLARSLGARVDTQFVLSGDLWRAHADRAQVEGALLNLSINARDAMPEGGKLTIETCNTHLDEHYAAQNTDVTPGDYVALAVTDTGIGMSREVRERALEPFFSTKGVGKGSGLGLSMVYGFARQSKGHVEIYSEVGRGTTVRLYLPRDTTGAAETQIAAPAVTEAGDEAILVVEDDLQVRQLATESLRQRGYTVVEATNGAEAVAQLDGDVHFDLVLTDMVMPGPLSGRDVAEHASKVRPGVRVLFTSAMPTLR